MGGTCLKEVGDLRQIVFQQRYKSPQFTLDILSSPTLVDRAGLASIEAYCRRHCSCPHVSYKSKDPDFIPSTKRQRVERGSRQSLRGQFRLPSTDGESSSSMTTDGLEAGSERSPEGTCASLKSVPLGSSGDSSTCAKKAYCSGRSDCSRGQLCKAVQKDVARPLNFNLRKFIGLCAAAPLSIGDTLYG
ncbi:MAG: hypothetical protein M1814_002001 [Vezdaea aestivalis]|nr:MAG: hypothetical protein M1814_002001 [Vezdaea aestivalis]